MKSGIILAAGIFISAMLAGITQIWFTLWSAEIFAKVEITLGALLLMDIVMIYVLKEYMAFKAISQAEQIN